ncbi:MAG: SpoIIE family protein phosphatase [Clostridiales bacterium]|nr:SpoIIE family protein phosphatase [Clostridiales bacterium]
MNIDKLRDSKQFLQKLMEVAITPIFVVDKDMIVQSFNNSFSSLFNRSENEIIGKLPGNAFGCVFASDRRICGETDECVKCILRKLLEKAIRENKETAREVIEKEFNINNKVVKKQLSLEIKPLSFGEEKYYVGIFNDVSDVIDLKDRVYMQYEKMKRDLLVARGLQNSLLPVENEIGPLEFSYIFKPCETLGGDFLDFYRIDRQNIAFIIADVAGHGITSSMFTMFLYSMINRDERSPALILESAFREFSKFTVTAETYITMLIAVINTRNKTVTFANAGFTNPPAVVYGESIEKVEVSGIPISNWVDDAVYEEKRLRFKSGDRLIFFSDGITEMRTETSSFIGGDYLYSTLADRSIPTDKLVQDVFNHSYNNEKYTINDDITIAIIDHK